MVSTGLAQLVNCSEHATEITVQHIFNFCRIKVNRSFCIWVSACSLFMALANPTMYFIGTLYTPLSIRISFAVRCLYKVAYPSNSFCNVGFPQGGGTRYKGINRRPPRNHNRYICVACPVMASGNFSVCKMFLSVKNGNHQFAHTVNSPLYLLPEEELIPNCFLPWKRILLRLTYSGRL